MVNANWLPVPGLVVAVIGLAAMVMLILSNRDGIPDTSWAWTAAKTVTLAGMAALLFGVGIGMTLILLGGS